MRVVLLHYIANAFRLPLLRYQSGYLVAIHLRYIVKG